MGRESLFDDPVLDELYRSASRPWYRFGRRSVAILLGRARNKHRPIFRLRMAWQRMRRGYDDSMVWNLNTALATLIVAGTSYMLDYGHGHPAGTEPEEWNGTLTVIRTGFQDWLDADGWLKEGSDEERRFKDAMANVSHWFGALWD